MYNLTDQMRAAAAMPPPTGIDLDSLIAAGQRRSRVMRWGGGIATTVTLAAILITAPLLLGEGGAGGSRPAESADGGGVEATVDPTVEPTVGGTCPTPATSSSHYPGPQQSHPAPRPTEACGAAVQRLSRVLTEALQASAPDVSMTAYEPTVFVYDTVRLRYEAGLALAGPNGLGYLGVEVLASHEHPDSNPECPPGTQEPACTYEVAPDGTILLTNDLGSHRKVLAYLKDGTMIAMYCNVSNSDTTQSAADTGPPPTTPPLTVDQLKELASNSGLTLFP